MVFPTDQFLVRLFSIGFTVITVVDDNIPYNGNKTNDNKINRAFFRSTFSMVCLYLHENK